MIRNIAAVIIGYLTMALFVMVAFSITWIALGQSFAFEEGTTNVTAGWIAIALVLSAIAAVIGGWVATLISRKPTGGAVKTLAALVLVFGIATALMHLSGRRPEPPADLSAVGTFEAAQYAIQPTWYEFAIAFIGAAGVLAGGRLRGRSSVERDTVVA